MHRLPRTCLHRPAWALWAAGDAPLGSGWRACPLFNAAQQQPKRQGPQPLPDAKRPEWPPQGTRGAASALAESHVSRGSGAAEPLVKEKKGGSSGVDNILVQDPAMSATRAAKLLRLRLRQEGPLRERHLADVVWRVRTPADARAALNVTELFAQHRAARQQLRTFKKYVSEKLVERALKAGARDVAEEALARAGELDLRITRPMLRRLVVAAAEARDLDTAAMLHRVLAAERFAGSRSVVACLVRAYLKCGRPELARGVVDEAAAFGLTELAPSGLARLAELEGSAEGGPAGGAGAAPGASAGASVAAAEQGSVPAGGPGEAAAGSDLAAAAPAAAVGADGAAAAGGAGSPATEAAGSLAGGDTDAEPASAAAAGTAGAVAAAVAAPPTPSDAPESVAAAEAAAAAALPSKAADG